jgi:hypothetical protein
MRVANRAADEAIWIDGGTLRALRSEAVLYVDNWFIDGF